MRVNLSLKRDTGEGGWDHFRVHESERLTALAEVRQKAVGPGEALLTATLMQYNADMKLPLDSRKKKKKAIWGEPVNNVKLSQMVLVVDG